VECERGQRGGLIQSTSLLGHERTGFSLKELGTNPKPTRPIKEKSPIKENNPCLADVHTLFSMIQDKGTFE
jgi:hypothetical protein